MENAQKKKRPTMAPNIIGVIVLMLALFGVLIGVLGFVSFREALKKEYAVNTYHIADTASTLINADHLEAYLAGNEVEEYQKTKAVLDSYCRTMSVSLVYVIRVDTSDYGRFVSVFNAVDNSVDNTSYDPWKIGHRRNTTNQEYRDKYKALYETDSPYETVYRTKPTDNQHPHITTLVPVRTSAGKVTALLCVQRPIREQEDARRPYVITVIVSISLLAILVSLFLAVYIRRWIVRPIGTVAKEATRFARENTQGDPLGNISRFEEIASLADSIDTMETEMTKYVRHLTEMTAQKERMDTEMDMAARIQDSMLPRVESLPDIRSFDISASMVPAREVGGDFYDFFLIDEKRLCLVIADVSGKGIPAALFMMASKIILQSCARLGKSPAEILAMTNQAICSRNQAQMFVTVWLGILDLATGKLTAANAGHEYPMLAGPGKPYELIKDKHGFVLGGMEGIGFKEYEMTLEAGSRLFVYTDGLPEATDAKEEMFGTGRTLDALNGDPQADPAQVLENVRKAETAFVGDAEPFDDLTMMCVRYNGPA